MKSVLTLALTATLLLCSFGQCRADEVTISGEIVGAVVVEFGELTFLPGGIVILTGAVGDEFLNGDLAGTMRVTSNFVVNVNTGEGILFGEIDWMDPNGDGGLRGPFLGAMSGAFGPGLGEFDGHWELHGYGTRQGETAQIDNYGPFTPPPFQVYEGVLHKPNGP